MCQPYCLPLGCIPVTKTIEKPAEVQSPPTKMLCPRCGEIGEPIFKKVSSYFCLCFIPCFPCGAGNVYLACSKCDFSTGSISGETCSNCNVTTVSKSNNCPSCGKARSSVGGMNGNSNQNNSNQNPDTKSDQNNNTKKDDSNDKKDDSDKDLSSKKRGKRIGDFKN